MNARDLLEAEIIKDGINGDTTVLASLLELLTDKQIYDALSDENQRLIDEQVEFVLSEDAINGIQINDKIIDDDLFEYKIIHRKSFIDELIGWIGEATKDKQAMKDDLEYLLRLDDEYIFSSISTNEYISKSDGDIFNETCEELLELNESLK